MTLSTLKHELLGYFMWAARCQDGVTIRIDQPVWEHGCVSGAGRDKGGSLAFSHTRWICCVDGWIVVKASNTVPIFMTNYTPGEATVKDNGDLHSFLHHRVDDLCQLQPRKITAFGHI